MRRINKTPAQNSLAAEVDIASELARLLGVTGGLDLGEAIEFDLTKDNGYAASLADFRAARRPGGET